MHGRAVWPPPWLPGCTHLAPVIEDDLGRIRQVAQVCVLHLRGERSVFDDRVELAIAQPAGKVEVRRADARPAAVRDGCLRVNHRSVPLEDADPRFEERTVTRPRE